MTSPMYCPLAFNNGAVNQTTVIEEKEITVTKDSLMECNPNCAWAINCYGSIYCAIAFSVAKPHANSFMLEGTE